MTPQEPSRDPEDPGVDALPVFPGFAGMARRHRRLVAELAERRRQLGLSQTQVAARMRTSQSAVARLESQAAGDVRLSTLARYAAAVGQQIDWQLRNSDASGDPG